jgi:hypothetical protein
MVYWTLRGFCVWKLVGSLTGEMNVSCMVVVVVVGGSARSRWETEGFVWKLFDSCHQHA